jgi:hypothetical protein
MNELPQAITLLRQHLNGRRAVVAIASDTAPEESSLCATPTGYIHFACTLLELVHAAQTGTLPTEPDGSHWDDAIKSACMNLPGNSTFLVGAYVLPTHEALLTQLQTLLASDLPPGYLLSTDPDLASPPPPALPTIS